MQTKCQFEAKKINKDKQTKSWPKKMVSHISTSYHDSWKMRPLLVLCSCSVHHCDVNKQYGYHYYFRSNLDFPIKNSVYPEHRSKISPSTSPKIQPTRISTQAHYTSSKDHDPTTFIIFQQGTGKLQYMCNNLFSINTKRHVPPIITC